MVLGEVHWGRGGAVVRQASSQVRQARKSENYETDQRTLPQQQCHKGRKHRQDMDRDAGKTVVRVKVNQEG